MEPTKNIYPVFEANQVLTNEHLNQGFDYLDEQERLTRANLTGIGIVCGLEISFDGSVINISQGRAITSEGYLVVLPEGLTLGFYKDYHLPKDLEYEKFLKPDRTQFDLWEITADSANSTPLPPLNNPFWQGEKEKAVLLFVELIKEDLKDCSPNNCNDKGAKVTATIRPLLIDKINIPLDSSNQNLQPVTLATAVSLSRPKKFTGENYIDNYKDELGNILEAGDQLEDKLTAAYNQHNAKYNEQDPNPFIGFKNLLSTPEANFIQYYYDFLLDVIQAYNELICFTVRNPVCACVPDPVANTFPRHLMLGSKFDGTYDKYRHAFTPSKALIDQHGEAQTEELGLYMRLVEITKKFQPAALPAIKITPTQYGDFPLAQKAIPCYYDISSTSSFKTFAELWTTGKRCSGLAVATNSYHSTNNPLEYHLEAYNFFRIEGHVSQNMTTANANNYIQRTITDENLPFSVLSFNSTAFNEFALKHPGLTHGAGVPSGGTFIMVSDTSNKVIADFFLPYQVLEASDLSVVCEGCKQKEIPKICLIFGLILIILFMYLTGNKSHTEIQRSYIQESTKAEKEGVKDIQHWDKRPGEKI